MESIFLNKLKGISTERPPVWFMRQAGRVLPSYLKLKEKYTFWEMMKNPDMAAKVTLLPVYDLGVDAAILFSDILVIPYALGMGLDFTDNGPIFENPIKTLDHPLKHFHPDEEKLNYIYNAIDAILRTRPENTPLIGFCGAPLTVLSFMIQGLGSRSDFTDAVKWMFSHPKTLKSLMDIVTEMTLIYVQKQIDHGINAFQLFETNAGLIPNEMYQHFFMPSVKKISTLVRDSGIPFIYFPKGIGNAIKNINYGVCDYVSVDWLTSLEEARNLVDKSVGLQGNLDPRILFAPQEIVESELQKFLAYGRKHKDWIFNLGHGFMPGTPFKNARFITDWVKNQEWN